MIDIDLKQIESELINFDITENKFNYINISVCGLVEKLKRKTRINVSIENSTKQLQHLIGDFDKNYCYKFISVKGGFASINFIDYICKNETIEELTVFTLAVGKKQIQFLDKLKNSGRLKKSQFILGVLFKERGLAEKYNYYDEFIKICNKNNWRFITTNNHAKIILMKTKDNYYILETSSNLNENPKMEQFSFEEDKSLYNFYYSFCSEIFKKN